MAMDQPLGMQTWIRGPLLGCGAYGAVNLALDRQTGQLFAVKSVESDRSAQHLEALEKELELLQLVNSERVVRCLGSEWTVEDGIRRMNLKMEHMAGGSISDLMKNFGGRLDEVLIRQYTKGILEGLRDLHDLGIVHSDIKGKNVLVGEGGVKLCDLGAAVRIDQSGAELQSAGATSARDCRAKVLEWGADRYRQGQAGSPEGGEANKGGTAGALPVCGTNSNLNTTKLRGTICWMAPEVLQAADVQGTSADIWSVGCTVIEMATGKMPWMENATDAYGALYKLGCTSAVPEFPASLSPEGLDFLASCLQRDPSRRPTAGELLEHPFLKPLTPAQAPAVGSASPAEPRQPVPHLSKPPRPRSPTSVLTREESSSDWSIEEPVQVARPPPLRRTESEVATSSTRRPESRNLFRFHSPSLGSFPSFKELATSHILDPEPNSKPQMTVEIPTLRLPSQAESKAEMPRCSSEGNSWNWWSSPRSPTAAEGQWITVHSSPSSPRHPVLPTPDEPSSDFQTDEAAGFLFPAQEPGSCNDLSADNTSIGNASLEGTSAARGRNELSWDDRIDEEPREEEAANGTACSAELANSPADLAHDRSADGPAAAEGELRRPIGQRLAHCFSFNGMLEL